MTQRVVALGASNLTRGFGTVVSTAAALSGPGVEVVAALGHGRSYGAESVFLARRMPGILQSGLWRHIDSTEPIPTRALIADVGNDVAYGFSPDQILLWIEDAINRLQRVTDEITLTDLPLASMRRLSVPKYLVYRSILVPSCRLSLAEVLDRSERVNIGLERLAARRRVRFFRLRPEWYGFDPIHIRARLWESAWREILGAPEGSTAGRGPFWEQCRLYFMPPERQSLFGRERVTPQNGLRLASGARVWLY